MKTDKYIHKTNLQNITLVSLYSVKIKSKVVKNELGIQTCIWSMRSAGNKYTPYLSLTIDY